MLNLRWGNCHLYWQNHVDCCSLTGRLEACVLWQGVFPAVYTVSADDDVNFVMLATLKPPPQQKRTPKQHASLVAGLQKQWKRLAAAVADNQHAGSGQKGVHAETIADIEDAIERCCMSFTEP